MCVWKKFIYTSEAISDLLTSIWAKACWTYSLRFLKSSRYKLHVTTHSSLRNDCSKPIWALGIHFGKGISLKMTNDMMSPNVIYEFMCRLLQVNEFDIALLLSLLDVDGWLFLSVCTVMENKCWLKQFNRKFSGSSHFDCKLQSSAHSNVQQPHRSAVHFIYCSFFFRRKKNMLVLSMDDFQRHTVIKQMASNWRKRETHFYWNDGDMQRGNR